MYPNPKPNLNTLGPKPSNLGAMGLVFLEFGLIQYLVGVRWAWAWHRTRFLPGRAESGGPNLQVIYTPPKLLSSSPSRHLSLSLFSIKNALCGISTDNLFATQLEPSKRFLGVRLIFLIPLSSSQKVPFSYFFRLFQQIST